MHEASKQSFNRVFDFEPEDATNTRTRYTHFVQHVILWWFQESLLIIIVLIVYVNFVYNQQQE